LHERIDVVRVCRALSASQHRIVGKAAVPQAALGLLGPAKTHGDQRSVASRVDGPDCSVAPADESYPANGRRHL
jgi:hypothetical protein